MLVVKTELPILNCASYHLLSLTTHKKHKSLTLSNQSCNIDINSQNIKRITPSFRRLIVNVLYHIHIHLYMYICNTYHWCANLAECDFVDHLWVMNIGMEHLAIVRVPLSLINLCQSAILLSLADNILNAFLYSLFFEVLIQWGI